MSLMIFLGDVIGMSTCFSFLIAVFKHKDNTVETMCTAQQTVLTISFHGQKMVIKYEIYLQNYALMYAFLTFQMANIY